MLRLDLGFLVGRVYRVLQLVINLLQAYSPVVFVPIEFIERRIS